MTPLRICYLTAGAAGMYCGSCMHDNTLARALAQLGVDIQLVPMYTPIRTDEADQSENRVFFGGINVYLQQQFRLFRHLPTWLDRLLDRPALLRWIGSRGLETDAQQLGDLAISMLRGLEGYQRKEVQRLGRWLSQGPRPDVINLTNVLVAGCVTQLRATFDCAITVTLQGDDIFLEQLPAAQRAEALEQIRRIADQVDALLVHSDYYGEFMAQYLSLPPEKFRRVPLGIDTTGFGAPNADAKRRDTADRPLQIGYLARQAPEKGLHLLVEAFVLLSQRTGSPIPIHLNIAGWLGTQHGPYVESQLARLSAAGLSDGYTHLGTVDRQEKQRVLSQLDLFSVPAVYREPKGLYVLEALAAGVPVVLPDHGAFPELVAATGGGRLVKPDDPAALAQALQELIDDPAERHRLGLQGQQAVHQRYNATAMAEATLDVFQQVVANRGRRRTI